MTERLTLDPHGGQKRSWAFTEDAIPDDWLSLNKRVNYAGNVLYPGYENYDQPYSGPESLRTHYVDRLRPQYHFDYDLLTPEPSIVDCDTNNTGSAGNFGSAEPMGLNWDEHIDASFVGFDESVIPAPEEICFGTVRATVNSYHYVRLM